MFFLVDTLAELLLRVYFTGQNFRGNFVDQAFFSTPPAEKTKKLKDKTQAKNSRKKTQPLGGFSLPYAKLKGKTKISKIFFSKLKIL